MDYVFQWVIQNHGIDTEDYPYQAAERTNLKNKVVLHMSANNMVFFGPQFEYHACPITAKTLGCNGSTDTLPNRKKFLHAVATNLWA